MGSRDVSPERSQEPEPEPEPSPATTQPIAYPERPEPAGSAAAGGPATGGASTGEPGTTAAPGGLVPARRRSSGLGCLLAVLVAAVLAVVAPVVALIVGVGVVRDAFAAVNPFDEPVVSETTIDRSGRTVLVAIEDLGEYRAASAYYELVIDVERDVDLLPSFLAGERVLFVAAGSVDATVDFTDLEDAAVVIDEERTSVSLVLPPPELGEPALDLERSYVYSRDRGLADRLTGVVRDQSNDEQELYLLAEERFAEAASGNDELLARAEANTRDLLVGLLGSLGFTDVTVEFAAGNAGPASDRPAPSPAASPSPEAAG